MGSCKISMLLTMKLFNILLISAAHVLAKKNKGESCNGVDVAKELTCNLCNDLETDFSKCFKKSCAEICKKEAKEDGKTECPAKPTCDDCKLMDDSDPCKDCTSVCREEKQKKKKKEKKRKKKEKKE